MKIKANIYGKESIIPSNTKKTILESLEDFGLDVPYSCRVGVCSSCKCLLISGEVKEEEMCLTDKEKSKGWIITCQSFPITDIEINFDI